MIKVYLDNCVYNRPFDNQSDERIFIEAKAFYIIIKWIEEGRIASINSDALEYENSLTSEPDKRMRVKTYLDIAKEYVKLSDSLIKRANEIISLGIRDMDGFHVAMAEGGKADYFVTCDDGIISKAKEFQETLKVKVCSVLEFLEEVVRYVEANK